MQRSQLGCGLVRRIPRIARAALRGDGILILVVEPGIEERRRAVHLGPCDVGIPVGDRSESGPSGEVYAGQAERGRDEGAGPLAVGTKGLAILVELGVVAAWAPAGENLLHGHDIDAEEIGEWLEVRCQRHDRADVEIAVGPVVEPLTNARRERVVDGRMTKRALDAHRPDAAVGVGEGGDADDGVELEQGDGRGWIVEVDLGRFDLLLQSARQRVCLDLEANGQRGFWRDARTDTAVFLTGNGFMQLKRVTPEDLAPERLVAESFFCPHRATSARTARSPHRRPS